MTEEWRVIPDLPAYEVSSLGRVRSLPRWSAASRKGTPYMRFLKGKILTPSLDDAGRPKLTLCENGVHIYANVCALVAAAFIGPRPAGEQVCHWDGNPAHNAPDNLRYGTPLANSADCKRHGRNLVNKGEENPAHVLTEADIPVIRKLSVKLPPKDLAAIYDVHYSTIRDVLLGRTWAYVQ